MTEPIVICENLVKIYQVAEMEVVALQGLDLLINRGELMGIIGASGSGKSTLLNVLGGLDRPSAGRVTVNGLDLLKAAPRALDRYRRTAVGFVWQQTARNLIPYLSARANVELPMTVAGLGWREKRKWSQELLEAVGLWEHRQHRLTQLSGGQQQRVAIAVALANKPALLLADEPTGELDSITAQEILQLLRQMNERYGLTTIIVTHDPGVTSTVDRVMTIRDGRTSSETVRRVAEVESSLLALAEGEAAAAPPPTSLYEEYVVIDSVGRLQLPHELLTQAQMGNRAIVEATEEGILLKPVNGREAAAATTEPTTEAEEPTPVKGLARLWQKRKK